MMSQANLANAFERGEKRGKASNVQIVELCGGWTALVGYGWAAYAVRTNSPPSQGEAAEAGDSHSESATDGTIHYYEGWYGYSPSTSCQLSRMGLESMADVTHDSAAELKEFNVSGAADMPEPAEAGTSDGTPNLRGRW